MKLGEWKRMCLSVLAAGALVAGLAGVASATLILRGTGTGQSGEGTHRLIYDTDLDVTWFDFTKSASSWSNQVTWASNLSVTFGSTTYDDWRLPTTVDDSLVNGWNWADDGSTSRGYNNTTSEMGHLYYTELGNKGAYGTTGAYQSDFGLRNRGQFENLYSDVYWSGTEYALIPDYAWYFYTGYGDQDADGEGYSHYALAVRPGDVYVAPPPSPAPVPEPSTMLMLGTGLIGLIGTRIRRRGQQ